jgi:hypothetical protein
VPVSVENLPVGHLQFPPPSPRYAALGQAHGQALAGSL